MTQLLLDLEPPLAPTLDNFIAGRNAEVVAALRHLATTLPEHPSARCVYLFGPSSSGLSHLARAACDAMGGTFIDGRDADAVTIRDAVDRSAGAVAPTMGVTAASGAGALAPTMRVTVPSGGGAVAPTMRDIVASSAGEASPAMRDTIARGPADASRTSRRMLAVDGVEALDADAQEALFHAINALRDDPRGALVVSGRTSPRDLALKPGRDDLRSRLAWGLVYPLHRLDDDEKDAALADRADKRGFPLTTEVRRYLLTHFSRDLGSLMRMVDALDRHARENQRVVTVPLIRDYLQRRSATAPFADEPT